MFPVISPLRSELNYSDWNRRAAELLAVQMQLTLQENAKTAKTKHWHALVKITRCFSLLLTGHCFMWVFFCLYVKYSQMRYLGMSLPRCCFWILISKEIRWPLKTTPQLLQANCLRSFLIIGMHRKTVSCWTPPPPSFREDYLHKQQNITSIKMHSVWLLWPWKWKQSSR